MKEQISLIKLLTVQVEKTNKEKQAVGMTEGLTEQELETAASMAFLEYGDEVDNSGMSIIERLAFWKKAKADFVGAKRSASQAEAMSVVVEANKGGEGACSRCADIDRASKALLQKSSAEGLSERVFSLLDRGNRHTDIHRG